MLNNFISHSYFVDTSVHNMDKNTQWSAYICHANILNFPTHFILGNNSVTLEPLAYYALFWSGTW